MCTFALNLRQSVRAFKTLIRQIEEQHVQKSNWKEYRIQDSTSVTNLEDKLTLLTLMIANTVAVVVTYGLQTLLFTVQGELRLTFPFQSTIYPLTTPK